MKPPKLPLSHYKFSHKYFPVGFGIPCRISASRIVEEDEEASLILTLSYGPYIKANKVTMTGIDYVGNEPPMILKSKIPKRVELYIPEKRIEIRYFPHEYYDLIKLFTNFGIDHSKVEYPEQLSEDIDGKKSDFAPIKKVFDDFFIPHQYKVFVDVESYYDNNLKRAFTFPTSRIRKNRKS